MRARIVALASCILTLSGCVAPSQEDVVVFHSAGAFEVAVADDAKVEKARADSDVPGGFLPALPMQAADLDAAWAPGRYALESIHWWGPSGPPTLEGDGFATTIDASEWQGFLVDAYQLQLVPGSAGDGQRRLLGDQFLQNVTTLSKGARTSYLDDLLDNCDVLACTAPLPGSLDAARAWHNAGGLHAVTRDDLGPTYGQQGLGSWWFNFEFDTATLEDGLGPGGTTLEVGSNDVVGFTWRSAQQHTDAQSYAKLQDVLEEHGLEAPSSAGLDWTHRQAETD